MSVFLSTFQSFLTFVLLIMSKVVAVLSGKNRKKYVYSIFLEVKGS